MAWQSLGWETKKALKDSSPKNKNSVIIYSPLSCSRPVWICSKSEPNFEHSFYLFSESEQANELCQDYEHNLEALRGVSVSSACATMEFSSCPLGKISLNITVHVIHDNYISINNCGRSLSLCDVTQPRIWERLNLKKGVLFIWIKKKNTNVDYHHYWVVVYTHCQHKFMFKQHVKVNFASDDPFKNCAV